MLTKDASEKQNTTLSAAKRALLEKRLRGEAIRNTPAVVIPKRSDVEFAPATFTQQRLWFLDQLEPGSTTYNVPIALRIRGQFEVSVLEQALNELLRRHETWRTTLESRDGLLIQHIHESGSFALSVQDVTALPVAEREREAMSLMSEHAQIPFKLTEGPLVRALMVKLNETEHWLVLTQHHSITDGWSVGIILHEITVVYEALMMGKPSPLADLPVQYADYACWQQQTLSGQELEKQLEYWRQQLADAPPQLDLPTRKAHADQRTSHGSTLFFHLTRKLSDDLRALCQREGVTPFMTFLAAFQLLLYRYTGQDELVIGTNVANRVLPELEGIAGYFTNLLILRTDLAGNPTFRELLGRVRDVSLAAFAHQEVPCERAAARPYDLQVHFILQNTPTQSKSVAGLSAERIEFAGNTAICDLFLNVEDTEEISCFFEYNTDLFDDETIQRMSTHFQHLLEECAQHPERKLSTFSLLSAAERQQLLFAWNDARAVEQRRGCIHELFEEQAARTPQHPALESEGTVLTYQELNARANQVAHYLRTVGVTSEVTVGLCLERSIDLMVGMLGIVKAGGCYLPIDPAYPDERLQMILSDAQMPVLLTHSTLAPRFADQQSTVLCLDARLPQLAEVPTTNPAHLTTDENAAYIIYTSGSTGKPKGVVISHR